MTSTAFLFDDDDDEFGFLVEGWGDEVQCPLCDCDCFDCDCYDCDCEICNL